MAGKNLISSDPSRPIAEQLGVQDDKINYYSGPELRKFFRI